VASETAIFEEFLTLPVMVALSAYANFVANDPKNKTRKKDL